MSTIRVLIVEDFEPFRRFICSTLRKKPNLRVICEVSDGLEAIHKATELQPDLILMDVGLPTLNGIESGRRIRRLAPKSRIVFLSQEFATDTVQAAVDMGAAGYLVKTRAASDLLPALESVLQGKQVFVSEY